MKDEMNETVCKISFYWSRINRLLEEQTRIDQEIDEMFRQIDFLETHKTNGISKRC